MKPGTPQLQMLYERDLTPALVLDVLDDGHDLRVPT